MIILDLSLWATKKDHKVFYVPMLIEGTFFAVGVTILWFRLPERWFRNSTLVEYYTNSSVIFAIFLVSFLFET